jgi:hypothetical protein
MTIPTKKKEELQIAVFDGIVERFVLSELVMCVFSFRLPDHEITPWKQNISSDFWFVRGKFPTNSQSLFLTKVPEDANGNKVLVVDISKYPQDDATVYK